MSELLKPFKFDLQLFAENNEEPETEEVNEGVDDKETSDKTEKTKEDKSNEKTFTQTELDDIITKRIERERKKYSDYDSVKEKLTEYEKQIEEKRLADLSEKERAEELAKKAEEEKQTLAQQLENLQKQVQQEKITNEFIKLATAQNIAYIDDALKLADLSAVKVNEDGKVEGVEEAVKALVENKPFLLKQMKEPKQIGGGSQNKIKGDKTAEQLLTEAAEKARNSSRIEDMAAYAQLKRELEV